MRKRESFIISIGAGKAQIPLIKRAQKRGYKIIAIDRDKHAPGFTYTDKEIVISTYDTKNVLLELENLNDKCTYAGVVARSSGPALYTASAIAERYNLAGLTKDIVPLATEKSKLREFCKKNNILMPKGQKVDSLENLEIDLKFPLIVKPDLPIVGKKDVKVVRKNEDLHIAVQKAINSSYNNYAELEEYIDGFDIACLFHLINGKAKVISYWDELVGVDIDANIIGLGVSVPSVILHNLVIERISDTINCIAEKFETINAIVIISLRIEIDSVNPYIIELHCDLGGDLIADALFPEADPNFDYFKICLNVAVNDNDKNSFHGPNFTPTAIIYNNKFRKRKEKKGMVSIVRKDNLKSLHSKINKMFEKQYFYSDTITNHSLFISKKEI